MTTPWQLKAGSLYWPNFSTLITLIAMHSTQKLIESFSHEAPGVLRKRFQEYGYLYIKQVLEKSTCDTLLQAFLTKLSPHVGYHHAKQFPILQGEPFFETDPFFDSVYPDLQALPMFQNIFHQQPLQGLMQTIVDDDVFVYPMKMARLSTPRKLGYETPPHQDAHSHQAGETMAGIWIPLHDVSASMGRLMVLPHSHKRGVRPVLEADGVGGVQCELYDDETVWHVSDVEQGDVIIFHSCCVHRAEPNTSEETVRISIDTRFCDYGAPVFTSNLAPHHGWRIPKLDWDYIYRDWQDTSLQYYWRSYPNFHGPSEESWKALAESIDKPEQQT